MKLLSLPQLCNQHYASIPHRGEVGIRGECIISWAGFEAVNKRVDESYSHPRNLAAGSIRLLDPSETRNRELHFCARTYMNISGLSGSTLESLIKNGFISRDGINQKLVELGAKPSGSVSKKTHFVIRLSGWRLQTLQSSIAWYSCSYRRRILGYALNVKAGVSSWNPSLLI